MRREIIVLGVILTIAAVGQIVLAFVLYNQNGHQALRIIGWAVLSVSAVFGWWPIFTFRRQGGVGKGKSYVHTTTLVDTGLYAIVRHPQYLAGVIMNLAFALIAQHWIVAALGLVAAAACCASAVYEEQSCLEKFGEAYSCYMQAVPRMNFILGIVRLVRRRTTPQE